MSLLRFYCALQAPRLRCPWVIIDGQHQAAAGVGPLAQPQQRQDQVQIVLPAADTLITRVRLPAAARRGNDTVLAFAVEEETVGEPENHRVCWLGRSGDDDVLAVLDKPGLQRWLDALDDAGIGRYEVHSEILMLPLAAGEWSLAWNGREGFVRTGLLEGAATDSGDAETPPLSLQLLLDAAARNGQRPQSLALYTLDAGATPDLSRWQQVLGLPLRDAGAWDWQSADTDAGASLIRQHKQWRLPSGVLSRLRPAAWIAGLALALHALFLVVDWTLLANEQRGLRRQMEQQFRAVFPEAVAVVDPALQMRRNLAQARHVAGRPDSGDFLPMIEQVAAGMKDLPAGSLRTAAYDNGRLTLQINSADPAAVKRLVARLQQSGLEVTTTAPAQGSGLVVLSVRAS